MSQPKRILVIKFRHIGDVLLTTPLISTLKRGIPDSRVCAVVKPGTETMLEGLPDLDALYVVPMRQKDESAVGFFVRTLKFLRQLRQEHFDLAINTTEGDRGILLSWLIGAKERWGLVKDGREKTWQARLLTRQFKPLQGFVHTVIRNLAFAAPLGLKECREVKLSVSESDKARLSVLLSEQGYAPSSESPLIHCHPTSRWMFKCWPADQMAKTIDWLHGQGCRVALTCAPDARERAFLDSILAACKTRPIDLGERLTLKQTAALSGMSRLFFGVDSAPMHMSAAMGTPTLGIFGPSGTFDWGPWPNGWDGDGTPFPGWNGVKHMPPHGVVQDDRDCAPCGRDGCPSTKRSECLEDLSADKVIHELGRMLGLTVAHLTPMLR
jgi:heptosyltransferase-3